MLAGWSAIAAAILTVTGLITLLAFFGTGSALLGALNDLNTIVMASPRCRWLWRSTPSPLGPLARWRQSPWRLTSSAWCWLPASASSWSRDS